jgi:hypothetical protein
MQVKMFRADKLEDLEAKVNAWLNEHGAKIDIEHTQTISGSEARDDANRAPSTLSPFGTTTSRRGRAGSREGSANADFLDSLGPCGSSFICLNERCFRAALLE